jgi:DNA-directed RNA polymerase specialized sigma24 family protein
MNSDSSGLTTMALVCRPPADQAGAVDHCIAHCRGILMGSARKLIARYHLADPAFDADDAVQGAVLKSLQAIAAGKVAAVETNEQALKLTLHKLTQEAFHEREREQAQKRGANVTSRVAHGRPDEDPDAELDVVDLRVEPPDARAIAADELEWLLKWLDARDRSLRPVAVAMAQQLTQQEIVARLGLSAGAVDHKVRLIRTILCERDTKHD